MTTRRSIQSLQRDYNLRNRSELETLVKTWRGIMALPPHHPNYFFSIAGYHGEPFRGPGVTDSKWWGWLLQPRQRPVPDLTPLPYWDELLDPGNPIHAIFTSPTFPVVGGEPNPLYSYALQEALVHNVGGKDSRYTKHAGYQMVRNPLSGLVGTEADRKKTEEHNNIYADESANVVILNKNVAAWLDGTVEIDDGFTTDIPDTYSVQARFRHCLEAPNYTVFSNLTSQTEGNKKNHVYTVSLKSPHNAIHLSVGEFYQKGKYNTNPIVRANGDMGYNETASFDPIFFFFHHCFIDYAFCKWQELHGKTASGTVDVIAGYYVTVVPNTEGVPFLAPGTALDMDTSLYPFRKPNQEYYSSKDVTDICQLGYSYEPGSLDVVAKVPHRSLSEIGS